METGSGAMTTGTVGQRGMLIMPGTGSGTGVATKTTGAPVVSKRWDGVSGFQTRTVMGV